MRTVNTATDRNGKRIVKGDRVLCISYYDKSPMNTVKVLGIRRQGADATILDCESAPCSDFPHHTSHRASFTEVQ